MRCEIEPAELSAHFDGEETRLSPAELDAHLSTCDQCGAYLGQLRTIRHRLRLEPLDAPPDLAPAVLAIIAESRRRRAWLVPAAAFLAGLLVGVVVFGAGQGPRDVLAFPIHERLLEVQPTVSSVLAGFQLTERGFHAQVPERSFEGTLMFVSPETSWLRITDLTRYPDRWVPNDMEVVIDRDRSWSRGSASCPLLALPACTPTDPIIELVTGRDPFSQFTPTPLDLVMPVSSFRLGGEPTRLEGPAPVARAAVGMQITAAQAAPMLEALFSAGHWREIHPTDFVELWMDQEYLVPIALSVFPSDLADRRTWAARRGYLDPPGTPYLLLEMTSLDINFAGLPALPPQPSNASELDAGFRVMDLASPVKVPAGFELVTAGAIESRPMKVWAWSDGVAYIRLDLTTVWKGPGLFGNRGQMVKPHGDLYLALDEERVFVHGSGGDAVLSGSVSVETLTEVAGHLPIDPRPAPAGWPESGTASMPEALDHLAGLLAVAGSAEFAEPAISLTGPAVVLDYAGGGRRGFRLIERPGTALTPPIDPDAHAVRLRGGVGRFSPSRGELEWVEDGVIFGLSSKSLGISEMTNIAEMLARP
jgi:hypothetical protein